MNPFALDLLERALATFGEAFCGALLLSLAGVPALPSLSIVEKAAGAGVIAVLALLKGVAGGLVGNSNTAALLPAPKAVVDHNPVPPLDPFAHISPPPAQATAATRARKR